MALGRNPRTEGRRPSSSSYCSTATLVLFVGLCLVGIWMMTSSAVVPVDISISETKSDAKSQVQTDMPFEDSSGVVPEGETKAEGATNNNDSWGERSSETSTDQKMGDDQTADFHEEAPPKGNVGTGQGPDDASPAQTYDDADGNEGQGPSEDVEQGVVTKKDATQDPYENGKSEQNPAEASTDDKRQSENEKKSDSEEKFDVGNTEGKVEEKQEMKTEKKSVENIKNEQSESGSDAGGESDRMQDGNIDAQIEEKVDEKQAQETVSSSVEDKINDQLREQNSSTVSPDDAQLEILNETSTQNGAWSTQATESKNEQKAQETISSRNITRFSWKLCNVSAGSDYIPCLDNEDAIKRLLSTKHYEHRERHCPEEGPTCLVPLPEGYRQPIKWPVSRDKIWYFNVPHTKLAVVKGHQNWVKVTGEYLTFPGGGTQFKHGALHYIDFIQQILPGIAWGKRSRVILDVGCGVASFGGYLFERDALTMSFAPKDEHEAQVQFALERGIPAISAVMGTKRLPFPSLIFDIVHCARCRVPWHIEGGKLLLELNRLLRPGGHFVWSATPVYQKLPEDVEIWNAMSELTKSMCWDLVTIKKDTLNGVGVAIYRKPSSNECYDSREKNDPPLCQESDDRDAAWNISLQACMHRVPADPAERGSQWPEQWPQRLEATPYWLNSSQTGVYGRPAAEDFRADSEHWKRLVTSSHLHGMEVNWSSVRNVMDMRSIYGGFAAALREVNVWVMNVVPIDSPDTLPIIYERGLFGMYHDWCESFSTYPRSYDLLHADHLLSRLRKRCKLLAVMAEVDRILRPGGYLIVRDDRETIAEVEEMARSLRYETKLGKSKGEEGLLWMRKTMWRPTELEANPAAAAAARASSTS